MYQSGSDQENRSYSKHVKPRDFNLKNMSQRRWGNWDISKSRKAPATSKLQEFLVYEPDFEGSGNHIRAAQWKLKKKKKIYIDTVTSWRQREREIAKLSPSPIPISTLCCIPKQILQAVRAEQGQVRNKYAEGCKHTIHLIWLSCARLLSVITSTSYILEQHVPKYHLPFMVCCCWCLVAKLCLTPLQPHGLSPARLLCPWEFPGKNTGVSYHFLLHTPKSRVDISSIFLWMCLAYCRCLRYLLKSSSLLELGRPSIYPAMASFWLYIWAIASWGQQPHLFYS